MITHSTFTKYFGFRIKDTTRKIHGRVEEQRFNAMFAKQKEKKKVLSVRKNMGKEKKQNHTTSISHGEVIRERKESVCL